MAELKDCLICGLETDDFSCLFNHKYHKACIFKETSIKRRGKWWACLLCDLPLKPKRVLEPKIKEHIGFDKRPTRCVAQTAKGKRCKMKSKTSYCHIHTPKESIVTTAEPAALLDV
jgi:hypothetical protein